MLVQPIINVLVVENDIIIMQRCRELLIDKGHKVRTAECAEEAVQIVQKHPADVDIMLLSLELPGWGAMTWSQNAGRWQFAGRPPRRSLWPLRPADVGPDQG